MQKAWLWISGANEASSEKRDCTCIHFFLPSAGPCWILAMTSANMGSAKEVIDHEIHDDEELASYASINLWFLKESGEEVEFSSLFITDLQLRHCLDRVRRWQALRENVPATVWLHLPPSTGLQLALLVHRLQTLNWHICIVQMGQSHWPAWN